MARTILKVSELQVGMILWRPQDVAIHIFHKQRVLEIGMPYHFKSGKMSSLEISNYGWIILDWNEDIQIIEPQAACML
jgi:hypothetical protein